MNDASLEQEKAKPPKKTAFWGFLISLLAALVLFVCLYLGFYLFTGIITKENADLKAALNNAEDRITHIQNNVDALQSSLDERQKTDAALQTTLQDIQNREQDKKTSLQMDDARYLTKLASNQILLGGNLKTVITFLQTADQELSSLPDPNLMSIRKALASDIAALQAVTPLDINGVYLKLMALNGQVDQLPLPALNHPSLPDPAKNDDSNASWWQQGLHESLATLKQLVVVRYHEEGVRPFISPDGTVFIRQNLHAMFLQAMTALLNHDADIYQSSLEQANDWIKTYFVTDAALSTSMQNAIHDLMGLNIHPDLPTVSASLDAFQAYSGAS